MSRFFARAGMVLWAIGLIGVFVLVFVTNDIQELADAAIWLGAILLASFTAFVAAFVIAQLGPD
jgi:hypothetical protein